jgi:uncharacterized protein YegJ (DUF2314 family)
MKNTLRRNKLALSLTGLALLNFVADSRGDNLTGSEVSKGSDEPEYFQVQNEHAEMHRAVVQARKTVRQFIAALQHPTAGQKDFEVKKPFVAGNQIEHIWLSDVQFIGNRFQGKIDNQPRKISGLQVGQLVSVNPNEISDWIYIDNGILVGGYTIRAHYNELTVQQKREFDRQADFRIRKQ